jgi:hypothetical protein
MGSAIDRRDRRYSFRLPGVILARKGEIPLHTGNVSFRGAFLETETPPQMRQLIRIRLTLHEEFEPDWKDREFVATGMVAHVVSPADPKGRVAGAGIEFYGLDGALRARWERFIHFVQDRATPVGATPGKAVDHAQGSPPRASTQLDVQLCAGPEPRGESSALSTQDISQGRLFIRTDVPLSVGAGLVVNLIDPTSFVGFPIDCVVRRRDFGSLAGVEVEFLEMPLATWLALVEFLKPVAPVESSRLPQDRPSGASRAPVQARAS